MPSNFYIFKYVDEYSNCSKIYDLVNNRMVNKDICVVRCVNLLSADVVANELRNIYGYDYKIASELFKTLRK